MLVQHSKWLYVLTCQHLTSVHGSLRTAAWKCSQNDCHACSSGNRAMVLSKGWLSPSVIGINCWLTPPTIGNDRLKKINCFIRIKGSWPLWAWPALLGLRKAGRSQRGLLQSKGLRALFRSTCGERWVDQIRRILVRRANYNVHLLKIYAHCFWRT